MTKTSKDYIIESLKDQKPKRSKALKIKPSQFSVYIWFWMSSYIKNFLINIVIESLTSGELDSLIKSLI
jgi:hypothetical protein